MKIKRAVGFLVFVAVFVCSFGLVYKVLAWKDTDGTDTTVFEGLYATEEELIDVLFLGSSHCYCTVNNAKLWEEYGYSTFNMAVSGQDMASTYFCLKEALATQNPKVVMVEMCYAAWYGYGVEGNLFRNLLNYKFNQNFVDAVQTLVIEEKQQEVLWRLPIMHTRYKELEQKDFNFKQKSHRGFVPTFQTEQVYNPKYTIHGTIEPLREETRDWLDKIVALSEKENFELVFFLAPFSATEADMCYIRAVEEYSQEKNITFLNFLSLWNEVKLSEETDFIDNSHVNYLGADKVTAYLGNYLSNTFELEDHRGKAAYELWDVFADEVDRKIDAFELSQIDNVEKYLNRIPKLNKNQTIVLSLDGDFKIPKRVMKKLAAITGSEDQMDKGGTWIIQDGKQIYSSKGKETFFHHVDLGQADLVVQGYLKENKSTSYYINNKTKEDEEEEAIKMSECLLNDNLMVKVSNGINILVYDHVLNQITDQVGFMSDSDLAVYRLK